MRNELLLVMATVRYDSYMEANTPNFDKVNRAVGAHSPTCVSSGSMFFYLHNVGPILSNCRTRICNQYSNWVWLPTMFKMMGYKTYYFTLKSDFYNKTQGTLSRDFDVFELSTKNQVHCMDTFVDDFVRIINIDDTPFSYDIPFFCVMHVPDTHEPFWYNDYIKSIEAVDNEFGRLLPYLKNTNVVITSDNGIMLGEEGDYYGSRKTMYDHRMTYISPTLFRIPLVKGSV